MSEDVRKAAERVAAAKKNGARLVYGEVPFPERQRLFYADLDIITAAALADITNAEKEAGAKAIFKVAMGYQSDDEADASWLFVQEHFREDYRRQFVAAVTFHRRARGLVAAKGE